MNITFPFLLASPAAGSQTGGNVSALPTLVSFGLIILVFYFFIIRPQAKKQKDVKQMLSLLKKGDKVITIGGIYGTVGSINSEKGIVVLHVDNDTTVSFSKSAISTVVEVEAHESKKSTSSANNKLDDSKGSGSNKK